jgi:hypothetical protein
VKCLPYFREVRHTLLCLGLKHSTSKVTAGLKASCEVAVYGSVVVCSCSWSFAVDIQVLRWSFVSVTSIIRKTLTFPFYDFLLWKENVSAERVWRLNGKKKAKKNQGGVKVK